MGAATKPGCSIPCAWMAGTCRPAIQFLATVKGRNKCPGGTVPTGTFYDDTHQYWDDNTGGTNTGSTFYWSIPFGTAGDNYLGASCTDAQNCKFDSAPGVNASYNYLGASCTDA